MISVIVPLYNKESYIKETVFSVLHQTFQKFELLIINDGSTDESLTIVNELTDPRIKIISITNSGVSVARNTGINNAKYDWIAFLDADDWWAPNYLAEIKAAIERFSNQRIFATGRTRLFQTQTERYSNNFLPKDNQSGIVNYFQVIAIDMPPINSSNCVISKEILENVKGFTPGMQRHEDHEFWIKLCAKNKILFINKPLSFYRKDTLESASQKPFLHVDFMSYLETINLVNDELSVTDKLYFSNYYNKFILISYFQNYYRYNSKERASIFLLCKKFTTTKTLLLLRTLNIFSFYNIYGFYKTLRGK